MRKISTILTCGEIHCVNGFFGWCDNLVDNEEEWMCTLFNEPLARDYKTGWLMRCCKCRDMEEKK
jgi:hypothetical protein